MSGPQTMDVGDGTMLVLDAALIIPLNPQSPSREHAIIWSILNAIPKLDRVTLMAMIGESDTARTLMANRGESTAYPEFWNRGLQSLLEIVVEAEVALG